MPILLSTILRETGVPLAQIRLIRHKDKNATRGFSPYEMWRDNRSQFEVYQSVQAFKSRQKLKAPYWAVFVVDLVGDTMFVGLYTVRHKGPLAQDIKRPHMDGVDQAGSCDAYELTLMDALSDLSGKLFIEWGQGARAWIQRADHQDKAITELRKAFQEPAFPGFLNFIQPLSKLSKLPKSWISALKSSRGVYLLTCPKTREQYVGSATGENGFWGRWQDYIQTGHGGNVELKSREPSDYQVSILEVAGTAATQVDVLTMEGRWQDKLQSREMGLNRNSATKS